MYVDNKGRINAHVVREEKNRKNSNGGEKLLLILLEKSVTVRVTRLCDRKSPYVTFIERVTTG